MQMPLDNIQESSSQATAALSLPFGVFIEERAQCIVTFPMKHADHTCSYDTGIKHNKAVHYRPNQILAVQSSLDGVIKMPSDRLETAVGASCRFGLTSD